MAKRTLEWKKLYSENDGVIASHDHEKQLRIMAVLGPFGYNLNKLTRINPPELEEIY